MNSVVYDASSVVTPRVLYSYGSRSHLRRRNNPLRTIPLWCVVRAGSATRRGRGV